MGFSSIFKRKNEPAPVSEPADEVQRARTRARQRLIGAVVLLAIGIIGFPLVFETQPRPIPVDIPIEIPRKDGLPPLTAPPARNPATADSSTPPAGPGDARRPPTPADEMITESREEAGRDTPSASGAEAASGGTAPASHPPPSKLASAKVEPKPAVKTDARPDPKPAAGDDGARARALLEGKAPTAVIAVNDSSRFIVQVGAFADAGAAQDTRQKIERLGLKTYTQVATTPAGPRIRVRVGPFPSRDEADKALAKARGAGISAVVLAL